MNRRLSLRARITIGSTLVAVLLLAAASAVVYVQLTGIVAEKEKAVLHGITEVYRGVIQEDPAENFEKPGANQHVAIVDPEGRSHMNTLPPGLSSRVTEIIAEGPRLHSVSTGHETFYVYVAPVETAAGTWYVIATRDTDLADDVLADIVRLLLIVLLTGAAVFAAGSWFVAGAALRPVERLRASADSLAVSRRGELLPVSTSRDELADLAGTLNGLLERMRASSDRERQMVSDASHELRNPLAVLQAQLELVDGTDAAADAAALADAKTSLARLTRIADSLLQLSRIESATESGTSSVEDLVNALIDSVDRIRLRVAEETPEPPLDLDFRIDVGEADDDLIAIGADDFGRVVDNLIENSLSAAAGRATRVIVALGRTGDGVVLSVSDRSGGFDPAVTDHAFERFVRGGESRYPGSGLGLAIVSRLAEKARGTARIESHQGVGANVVVTFARSEAASAPGRSANTHQR